MNSNTPLPHKPLKHAQISSHFKPGFHNNLKHSKNLKNYDFLFDHDYEETSQISTYLKRISSQVRNIRLKIFRVTPIDHNNDLYDVAKCVRRFRKLENFYRTWDLDNGNYTFVPKELMLYSKSASRLKKINTVTCYLQLYEQAGLQRAMRRGVIYPGITGITVDLRSTTFPNYELMANFFRGESIHDANTHGESLEVLDRGNMTTEEQLVYKITQLCMKKKDQGIDDDIGRFFKAINEENIRNEILNELKEEEGESFSLEEQILSNLTPDFVSKCTMREDIRPFYRFELFPNLKKLNFSQHSFLYPLGPFVIDGFKALQNLETLDINISRRSMGTNYIFRGLLELPLLKKFSLYISFLKDSDWALLQEFLKAQDNLQSFGLIISFSPPTRTHYLKQNAFLEETIQCLNNKPLLTSLELESRYWSLEVLSKGLSHLKMDNQLKMLSLEASDETITSERKLWKRIEGLCKFIKNQKESLEELHVLLPMALDGELLTHISKAISKLGNLRELEIEMNFLFDYGRRDMITYFQNTLQAEIPLEQRKQLVIPDKWKINVAKYFKRLHNLESLTFWIVPFNPEKKDLLKWFVEIVKVLPSLERLKFLLVAISGGDSLKNDEKNIVNALLGLENIQEIIFDILTNVHQNLPITRKVHRTIEEVHQRQATKSHLLF